jgi:GTP-binding protein EngB required for normal cell division
VCLIRVTCLTRLKRVACLARAQQQVGSTPGVTKGMQEIHLDKHIRLLDSPGIVFASGEGAAAAALRNAIKVSLVYFWRCVCVCVYSTMAGCDT